jgi:hypothetical protein
VPDSFILAARNPKTLTAILPFRQTTSHLQAFKTL